MSHGFTSDKSAEDTLSRVAKHDVSTRVRVESLKLFEISAFSAMLQRPRSKFPVVPPFFEVPYFGSFIGWPLPGAKVYHRRYGYCQRRDCANCRRSCLWD